MSEHKSPVQQALDLALYAPAGVALALRDALPGWVEKGRDRVTQQVAVARMVGEMAARQGQQTAARAIRQSTDTLTGLGIISGSPASTDGSRAAGTVDAHGPRPDQRSGDVEAPIVAPGAPWQPGDGAELAERADTSAGLAIPGYDSLSASQVVQRLAGLAGPELEAVQAYEAAGRGRGTILNKIAQLQSGRP